MSETRFAPRNINGYSQTQALESKEGSLNMHKTTAII